MESNTVQGDAARISALGGPTKVAALLGYDRAGGVQRVQNWLTRGIPPRVKLERPDLFLNSAGGEPAEPLCAASPAEQLPHSGE